MIVPYSILKNFPNLEINIISLENKLAINLESGLKIHCDLLFEKINLSQYSAIYLPGGVGAKWFNYEKWGKPHPPIMKLGEVIKKFLTDKTKYLFVTHKSYESIYKCLEDSDVNYQNSDAEHPLIIYDNFVCVNSINCLYDFTLAIINKLVDIDFDFENYSSIIKSENSSSKLEKIKEQITKDLDEVNQSIIINFINKFSVI